MASSLDREWFAAQSPNCEKVAVRCLNCNPVPLAYLSGMSCQDLYQPRISTRATRVSLHRSRLHNGLRRTLIPVPENVVMINPDVLFPVSTHETN